MTSLDSSVGRFVWRIIKMGSNKLILRKLYFKSSKLCITIYNNNNNNFGACRPWSWYPRLVDLWHQRRMNHVLQPFFANVSRWLWCVETPNAFWGHFSHPIVVMFNNNDCNNNNNNNNNNRNITPSRCDDIIYVFYLLFLTKIVLRTPVLKYHGDVMVRWGARNEIILA